MASQKIFFLSLKVCPDLEENMESVGCFHFLSLPLPMSYSGSTGFFFLSLKVLPGLGSESGIFWLFFYSSSLILSMSYSGFKENIFLKFKSLPRLGSESVIFWLFPFFISHFTNELQQLNRIFLSLKVYPGWEANLLSFGCFHLLSLILPMSYSGIPEKIF